MKSTLSPCAAGVALLVAAAMGNDATAQAPSVRNTPITPRAIAPAPAKAGSPTLRIALTSIKGGQRR